MGFIVFDMSKIKTMKLLHFQKYLFTKRNNRVKKSPFILINHLFDFDLQELLWGKTHKEVRIFSCEWAADDFYCNNRSKQSLSRSPPGGRGAVSFLPAPLSHSKSFSASIPNELSLITKCCMSGQLKWWPVCHIWPRVDWNLAQRLTQ